MRLKFGRYDYACFSAFSAYACCSLVIPIILVVMARELNFPLEDGGMSSGGQIHMVRSIAMVVSLLGSTIVVAKLGKRWTMGIAMLIMGIGIAACGLAHSYYLILPFVLFAGIGEGLCEAIATPFVHDLHINEEPGNYISTSHSFWSVGTGIVVIVAGFLLNVGVNWRFIIAGVGFCCMASSVLFIWKENPLRKYPELQEDSSLKSIFGNSAAIFKSFRFWIYCLGMFMGAGAEFCLTFWSASYIQLNFKTSPWIGGLGTAFLALGMFTGRFLYGRYIPEKNLRHLLLFAGVGGIPVTSLIMLLSGSPSGTAYSTLAILFVLMFLSGLCVAPYWPSLQSYGVNMLPELDSTLLFIYFSSIGIPGCGFFTLLMGIMGDRFGLHNSFLLIPITLVLFSLIIFLEAFVFKKNINKEDGQ